jgi:hypothetical protein
MPNVQTTIPKLRHPNSQDRCRDAAAWLDRSPRSRPFSEMFWEAIAAPVDGRGTRQLSAFPATDRYPYSLTP